MRVTGAELIAQPELLTTAAYDLTQLYQAYRHWMANNRKDLIKLMEERGLLCHFSDRLLLAGGYQNNHECLRLLHATGVDFTLFPDKSCDQVAEFLVPVKVDAVADAIADAVD